MIYSRIYVSLSSSTYLKKMSARLATQPYGLYSNVTQLLANMLTKLSCFNKISIIIMVLY